MPRARRDVDLTVRRLAMLSLHTSPLAQPGTGDSGGMNVYVRELVSALAQAGVDCTTYVRRWDPDLPEEVVVEPGFRVVHVDAGVPTLPKEQLSDVVDQFADGVVDHLRATTAPTSSTPTTGCRAWPATASSTSSTCRSCPRSTRSPG